MLDDVTGGFFEGVVAETAILRTANSPTAEATDMPSIYIF